MKKVFISTDRSNDNITVYENEPAVLVTLDRSDIPYLTEREYSDFPAIYVLIGDNQRYVGQVSSREVVIRLREHANNPQRNWFQKIMFFTRIDGNLTLTKALLDYLEGKLIEEFREKGFEMNNKQRGNNSIIDTLSLMKADKLWNTVFEILEDIANIDIFRFDTELDDVQTNEFDSPLQSSNYSIKNNNISLSSNKAIRVYIELVKELLTKEEYSSKMADKIIEDHPTFSIPLGRKAKLRPDGTRQTEEVLPGIFLYKNLSTKQIKEKIMELSSELDLNLQVHWHDI